MRTDYRDLRDFVSSWEASASPFIDQIRHQPGPAGLMGGAEAGAVVAVEIFEELQMIAPVRIGLESCRSAEDPPPAVGAAREEADHPVGELARHVTRRQRAIG